MDIIEKIKAKSTVRYWFKSRRLHVYCLGAAKTGTASMAGMFAREYRAFHEPCILDVTLKVEAMLKDQLDERQIVTWLLQRDKYLQLDFESSHPLSYFSAWLPELFPQALFLISIREPFDWLRSRLDFHRQVVPEKWTRYRNFIWSKGHKEYAPEEEKLSELGLYSLDGYLSQYSEQYKIIFQHIPESRCLIVNTSSMSQSTEKIAEFLSVPLDNIDPSHLNNLKDKLYILDQLDRGFVESKIEQHCAWLRDYMS